jgi:hypothetical protein
MKQLRGRAALPMLEQQALVRLSELTGQDNTADE